SFSSIQILNVCEDPRLCEQEWGNLMDPSIHEQELIDQEKVGDFFYRFRNDESGADVYDQKHYQLKDFNNCEFCILERNEQTGPYELKAQLIEKS
ncbi:unnamed protein product, partial [Didymodactylos carnosus]